MSQVDNKEYGRRKAVDHFQNKRGILMLGGGGMTDYEVIMIMLTVMSIVVTLVIAYIKK